jgi:bifunctional UDP-N-acetylglucosamine pyrophosphorylase / glucosamine-1-phosphate N-acetyltransferase
MNQRIHVVILAAGQGKRMKSQLPKVLHPIAGKPMLHHVLDTAGTLKPSTTCVIYGHGGDQVRAATPLDGVVWAKQEPQLGTGHAVAQALPHMPHDGVTVILYGDSPLISANTLAKLADVASQHKVAWLTMHMRNPTGLGRIIRDAAGKVTAIVEHKDATEAQRQINEVNTGFLAVPTSWLANWLPKLSNNNAQGEYYLTDILALAVAEGRVVETYSPQSEWEVTGVNSKDQLADLERAYQREIAARLMVEGTTLLDPARIDVRGTLVCGDPATGTNDVTIDVNCVFEGNVKLGRNVKIGANVMLRDCVIGDGTEVLPFSHLDGATIGRNARIGPYARIRPASTLADDVHVGNFVEIKASDIGLGSKANHLSYVGDTTVGKAVNIGAGTITCNYDGANKHRTVIEDDVHIGSDVQLVAPVTIARGTTVAAGTTVWKDTPAGELVMNPKTQTQLPGWKRPVKAPKK